MDTEPIIEIRKLKEINIEGGIVFDGFHNIGLTSTIACGCFINSLKTELVGILDSSLFSPMSVIYDGKPNFPARIYANEEKKLGFFVSELVLDPSAYRPVADIILRWSKDNKCKTIISIAGKAIEKEDGITTKEEEEEKEPSLKVISNSPIIMKEVDDVGILSLKNGTINGIPGILLNESNWKNIDVIVFIVDVIAGVPDFRAAANVVQAISKIVPEAYCEIQLLIKEAENIENNLKMINSQASNKFEKQMYR
ncbi:MAG TPA: PAC2 family protein [Nitrososphaeraceae archaeon]|nr:PAC2 family protein [Nitrososphaeraceae archaeon]